MKLLAAVLTLSLLLGLSGISFAGKSAHEYEVKLYGTVENVPDSGIGIWNIKGKDVDVTKDTYFDEKHGKAKVGAYVEVKGNFSGNTIKALEIDVKRASK